MVTVESKRLFLLRAQKAAELIARLRDDIRELTERLALVSNHNGELQELIDKVTADQQAIEAAVSSAMEELATSGFEDFEIAEEEELSAAEEYSSGETGSEEIETF